MAHAATLAETEQEAAEQFLPLIPFAAKFALPLLGKALPSLARGAARLAPRLIQRVAPNLTRGVGNLTRALYRNPTTRPMTCTSLERIGSMVAFSGCRRM